MNETIIQLNGIGKTFHTDEVETQALSSVQMTITPRKPKAEPTSPPTAEPRR